MTDREQVSANGCHGLFSDCSAVVRLGLLSRRMGDPAGHAYGGAIQAQPSGSQGVVTADLFRTLDWPAALCLSWAANDVAMARSADGQAAAGHGRNSRADACSFGQSAPVAGGGL